MYVFICLHDLSVTDVKERIWHPIRTLIHDMSPNTCSEGIQKCTIRNPTLIIHFVGSKSRRHDTNFYFQLAYVQVITSSSNGFKFR